MSTISIEKQHAIATYLASHDIPAGLGSEESACSIGAINLSLAGRLTDDIPACMSEVIGRWIIPVQDAMPAEMRNSTEWKRLLPLAAGTGREKESERLAIILEWMWATTLPSLQQTADKCGFGGAWGEMCELKTSAAAYAAARAAYAAADAAARAAYAAADAAYAAYAAARAAYAAADADAAWQSFDPCKLLQKLIEV